MLSSPSQGNEALITHHIHKSFKRPSRHKQALLLGKEHDAVQSVNFSVKHGEIFGLAGHNGAGKTTTLNIITGAIPPDKPGYKYFKNDKLSK